MLQRVFSSVVCLLRSVRAVTLICLLASVKLAVSVLICSFPFHNQHGHLGVLNYITTCVRLLQYVLLNLLLLFDYIWIELACN
jgi:hypothetical protein